MSITEPGGGIGTWTEWSRHVLRELERLNIGLETANKQREELRLSAERQREDLSKAAEKHREELRKSIEELHSEVTAMKIKTSLWGGLSGAIATSLMALGLWVLSKVGVR